MTDSYNSSRRGFLAGAASVSALGLMAGPAFAADYPSRPVTMIVPWGAAAAPMPPAG